MKIRQVGAEFLHADGQTDRQTDMTKLTAVSRNFGNAPKHANRAKAAHIYDSSREI
jgi:hypothetical protein